MRYQGGLSAPKQLWLLVGGNGAGKSTFFRLFLEPVGLPFVNADRLAQLVYPDAPEARSYEAARLATQQRENLLLQGVSFCFATVFSHPSKIDFIARAKTLGYQVVMVMIHLECPELNQARIAARVSEGGHQVPANKVISRIPRMLQQVKTSIPLCDVVQAYDNSSADDPFQPVFSISHGGVVLQRADLPAWAELLLAE